MAMEFVMAELILKGSGAGSGSCWVFPMVASASSVDSEIGSNLLVVVNWRMGTVAPRSGVIPTGGSDGPGGLLSGVSVLSSLSSMWLLLFVFS